MRLRSRRSRRSRRAVFRAGSSAADLQFETPATSTCRPPLEVRTPTNAIRHVRLFLAFSSPGQREMFSGARGGNRGIVSSAQEASRQLRIGCSGWNYAHWRAGVFYPPRLPQRDWLTYYAERFDTVELNTTFYRLPQAAVVARWVSETPPGFIFAVKVSRYITHIKRLTEVSEHLPLLYERIEPLLRSPKLGPLLWQLPPNYRYDPDRLEQHPRASPRWPSTRLRVPASLLVPHGDVLAVAGARSRPGDC